MEASYHQWHYSPVVKVGDTVIVSGIPAGMGDSYEARGMFEALKAHLTTAGATLADVVEITTYHAQPRDKSQRSRRSSRNSRRSTTNTFRTTTRPGVRSG